MNTQLTKNILKLLAKIGDYYSVKEIAEMIDVDPVNVSKKLNYIEKQALVEKTEDSPKRWCITNADIQHISSHEEAPKQSTLAIELEDLQKKLSKKTITNLETKQHVLEKLATLMDDSIAEVLYSINIDLKELGA